MPQKRHRFSIAARCSTQLLITLQESQPDAIHALQTMTTDLKKYIVIDETKPIIERMKPKVM
jgi:hypothetical protein